MSTKGAATFVCCVVRGRVRRSAATRRRDRSAAANRHGCRADSRSADVVQRAGESVRERSNGDGRRATTVRPLQLFRMSWRARRWRHGTEPARRRLDLRQQRRTDLQLDRGGTRARDAVVADPPDSGSDVEARRLHQIASDPERTPGAADSIEDLFMSRSTVTHAVSLALLLFAAGCSKPASSPGETQAGAAADLDRPPQSGGARPNARDLPSSDDLKKWLRAAPGIEGEAGGLFSGKMEWGTIVNRQGEICATAVATDDPASAWPGSQAISKAKAYTANAYSTDDTPLSTARLYTLTQPGHSLWGVAEPNPFRADCLVGSERHERDEREDLRRIDRVWRRRAALQGQDPGRRARHQRRHGLRRSRDRETCSSPRAVGSRKGGIRRRHRLHVCRRRVTFAHPLCANTWRNGKKLGDEAKAAGY